MLTTLVALGKKISLLRIDIGDESICLKELVNKQHKIVGGSCVAC